MFIVLFAFVLLPASLGYVFIVRPILKEQPMLSAAFKAEASLADQARAKLIGWRTKLTARTAMIAGVVIEFYDQLLPYALGQDWTPVTARIPAWTLPFGMMFGGYIIEKLRKMTENPPQVITQKDDTGAMKVVAVVKSQ